MPTTSQRLAARKRIAGLKSKPVHTQGDRFKARHRTNVPERSKPPPAQRRARSANIKKAQAARRKSQSISEGDGIWNPQEI